MTTNAVIDTSVLVSNQNREHLVTAAIEGLYTPIWSPWVIAELNRVMTWNWVRKDGLYVRFVPFHVHYKSFLFKDILRYKSISYSSLLRFGGWGIRFNSKGETAYDIGGNLGIELQLRRDKTVVVGSQNPDEFVKALDTTRWYNDKK